MRIECVGGGPAGLYFAILHKKAFPDAEIRVLERNRADDTFGWGVVFSDETLENFEAADAKTYSEITSRFRYWRDIETYVGGECVVSTGHGFAALERRELLLILQRRCHELGVELVFEHEVESVAPLLEADLVLAADGVNSLVRAELADHFRPQLDWRKCKFTWLGTTRPLDAFTFVFKENGARPVSGPRLSRSPRSSRPGSSSAARRSGSARGWQRPRRRRRSPTVEELFADNLEGP